MRYAPPVAAPAQRKAALPPAPAQPRRAGPPPGAVWQVMQRKAAQSPVSVPETKTPARSGLPAPLKAGIEHLSGIAMDGVRVHRNSPEPAKVGALAYARGAEIHLGPGQEKQLPHEAWHVVQQAQGRVRATMQMKSGILVNDDAGLEREADVMGARAAALPAHAGGTEPREALRPAGGASAAVAQRNGETAIAATAVPAIEEMADEYHEEDNITGNEEEELASGDLAISDIDSSQHDTLADALARRHPNVYRDFLGLVGSQGSGQDFLIWFNAGVMTRAQMRAQFLARQQASRAAPVPTGEAVPMQMARGAGDSYQAHYDSTSHGAFTHVTYVRNTDGAIDFAKVKSGYTSWTNPVKSGSEVQLTKGTNGNTHGITLNGTKIKIAGASRGTHFSMANRIQKNGAGSRSPDDWTWHHLPAKYKMVLVDRKVHAKHGHNGGVHLWK